LAALSAGKSQNGQRVRQIAIHGLGQNPDNEGRLAESDYTFREDPSRRQISKQIHCFSCRQRKIIQRSSWSQSGRVRLDSLQSEFGQLLIVGVPLTSVYNFVLMELSAAHFLFFFFLIPKIDLLLISKESNGRYQLRSESDFSLQETEAGSRAKGTQPRTQSAPRIENHYRTPTTANPCMLKPTDKEVWIRKGKEISRPINAPLRKTRNMNRGIRKLQSDKS
jgi:hypothetical protein